MTGFIARAACRGRRPSTYASFSGRHRLALMTQMLKERGVARFIVAPTGYGKTSLALEYAETMFGWAHVFWINGKSPCFIRDLDAGEISKLCFKADRKATLVVFEDVPALDAERAEAFSSEIDALLEHQCEVIVICTPSCCISGLLQRDRVQVNAVDLLLDDDELDASRTRDECTRMPAKLMGPANRVPALVWSTSEDDAAYFARQAFSEDIPADLLLVSASSMVLQAGTFDDLKELMAFDAEAFEELANSYPHLGFDFDLERFQAPPLAIEALSAPIKSHLEDIANRSTCESGEALVHAWAALLLRAGNPQRACGLVQGICSRVKQPAWLIENAQELVSQACFYPTLRLACNRQGVKGAPRMRLYAIEALCRRMLGDELGAVKCAQRCMNASDAPFDARMMSSLIAARWGSGSLAAEAHAALEAADKPTQAKASDSDEQWVLLAHAFLAGLRGPDELARVWIEYEREGVEDSTLCLCASWLFRLLDKRSCETFDAVVGARGSVERYVRARLECKADESVDFFSASAGLSMEEAHERGVEYEGGPLQARVLMHLRHVEMEVLLQRREFEKDKSASEQKRSDWNSPRPDTLLSKEGLSITTLKDAVPILSLRLFGRFEVMIGDEPVDYRKFRRQNARSLLVLLAVNQGRDLSRDAVASAMWPRSPEEMARKNFYTVWSQLRRALMLPDGTCPYLTRHEFGCSLEPRYVQSDVARLNEICREFMFGIPDIDVWSDLFAEIDRDFSCDLLPSETKNILIVEARNEYRTRLVDALVAATVSAVDTETPQWGIWFARSAVARDETREDAYVALMRAQIAAGQRTAAMMTYLKCRRVLADRLGIDPSPETTALYESLLDSL